MDLNRAHTSVLRGLDRARKKVVAAYGDRPAAGPESKPPADLDLIVYPDSISEILDYAPRLIESLLTAQYSLSGLARRYRAAPVQSSWSLLHEEESAHHPRGRLVWWGTGVGRLHRRLTRKGLRQAHVPRALQTELIAFDRAKRRLGGELRRHVGTWKLVKETLADAAEKARKLLEDLSAGSEQE